MEIQEEEVLSMDTTKRIVISGYYGFDNSGDDAILKAIVTGLKSSREDLDIIALSNNPKATEEVYGIKAVDRFKIGEVKKVMKNCDLFISGGGSLLQDITSTRSLIYYLSLMKLAKFYGRKVMVYANGVGPIDGRINRFLTKKILEKVDLITLRDQESRDFVESLKISNKNIHVTSDPVFSLSPIAREEALEILRHEGIDQDKNFVGIAIRDWKNRDKLVDYMAKLSDYMVEKYDVNVILIPMHYPEDLDISMDIASKGKKVYVLREKYSVEEVMGIIRELDMIVAMRLHSLIYAATQEVPMVGIIYDPKIVGFLNSIDVKHMLDIEDLDYDLLLGNIDEVMENKEKLKIDLKNQEEILKEKALKNIDMAIELLEK